jgi:hypothetical protein
LLSAGEVGGASRGEVIELDGGEDALDPPPDRAAVRSLSPRQHLERKGDIRLHVHVRPDRIGLKDHPEPPLARGHAHVSLGREEHPIGERDFTAVGRFEARDAAQGRGLPAAGRAEQGKELALLNAERDVVDGEDPLCRLGPRRRERLDQVRYLEHQTSRIPIFAPSL